MKWTLIVTSHGRWEYLGAALEALDDAVGLTSFDRRILSLDGQHDLDDIPAHLPFYDLHQTGSRQGLTANLTQAWGALTTDDEWVFHVEEDFLIRDAPLDEIAATLDTFPFVANMVLVRQPWGAHEIAAGSVLAAQPYELRDRGTWLQHHGGFWLNPFVAHSSTLRQLVPGVEQSLTKQALRRGWSFGYWGRPDDPPRCTHIGARDGMGSEGWLP